MIGILVAAHQDLGPALCRAAEGIVGPMEGVESISLSYEEAPAVGRRRIEAALDRLQTGSGVLILTDMFGGTPTNMCLPFLEQGRVEVLTGVNLPMLVKAHSSRGELSLEELAAFLKGYGGRNIALASEIWNARPQRRA